MATRILSAHAQLEDIHDYIIGHNPHTDIKIK